MKRTNKSFVWDERDVSPRMGVTVVGLSNRVKVKTGRP